MTDQIEEPETTCGAETTTTPAVTTVKTGFDSLIADTADAKKLRDIVLHKCNVLSQASCEASRFALLHVVNCLEKGKEVPVIDMGFYYRAMNFVSDFICANAKNDEDELETAKQYLKIMEDVPRPEHIIAESQTMNQLAREMETNARVSMTTRFWSIHKSWCFSVVNSIVKIDKNERKNDQKTARLKHRFKIVDWLVDNTVGKDSGTIMRLPQKEKEEGNEEEAKEDVEKVEEEAAEESLIEKVERKARECLSKREGFNDSISEEERNILWPALAAAVLECQSHIPDNVQINAKPKPLKPVYTSLLDDPETNRYYMKWLYELLKKREKHNADIETTLNESRKENESNEEFEKRKKIARKKMVKVFALLPLRGFDRCYISVTNTILAKEVANLFFAKNDGLKKETKAKLVKAITEGKVVFEKTKKEEITLLKNSIAKLEEEIAKSNSSEKQKDISVAKSSNSSTNTDEKKSTPTKEEKETKKNREKIAYYAKSVKKCEDAARKALEFDVETKNKDPFRDALVNYASKEMWQLFFKVEKYYRNPKKQFAQSLQTDGVGVSVYIHNYLHPKVKKPNMVLSLQEEKEDNPTLVIPPEILQDQRTRIIGCDPGRKDAFTLAEDVNRFESVSKSQEKDEDEDVNDKMCEDCDCSHCAEENDHEKRFAFKHYSAARYLHECGANLMQKRRKKMAEESKDEKGISLQEWQTKIPTLKTSSSRAIVASLTYLTERFVELLEKNGVETVRKMRWHNYINRQRTLQNMTNELLAVPTNSPKLKYTEEKKEKEEEVRNENKEQVQSKEKRKGKKTKREYDAERRANRTKRRKQQKERAKKRSEDGENNGKEPKIVVAFGDAKFCAGVPLQKLRTELKRRKNVIFVDLPEFRTSMLCSKCVKKGLEEGTVQNSANLPIMEGPLGRRVEGEEHRQRVHGVRVCQNTTCRTMWNRDENAAINMLTRFHYAQSHEGESPAWFTRTVKSEKKTAKRKPKVIAVSEKKDAKKAKAAVEETSQTTKLDVGLQTHPIH